MAMLSLWHALKVINGLKLRCVCYTFGAQHILCVTTTNLAPSIYMLFLREITKSASSVCLSLREIITAVTSTQAA